MSADRARLTHYPPRKYREVVSQQGRVVLEADSNEGQRIFTEETRHEALDFVGPCGTPDNGYEVVPFGNDFQIKKGTMYVGGLRVTLEADEKYGQQHDWRDTVEATPWGEGLWQDPAAFLPKTFEATLVLREQEITAVEDPAQREVALGGPDSGARTRLLQRVVAVDTRSATCASAAGDVGTFWSAHGLVYQPATAELKSRALLKVTPVTDAPAPSPCDPPSTSGYLGADNQMIRVQVTAFDPNTNAGTLLWGYYNASTLYRCTIQTASTLKLATRPVSAEYQPRSGQVVQVLSRAADLGEGAFAAALTGHFAKLNAPYAPDTQIVTLPAAMPQSPYANDPNVYLRLWEDQASFTLDTPVILAGTGLQVTITNSSAGPLHIGDYWCLAARPLTPKTVYPERLLTTPQPPDGPRMWACPLAVLKGDEAGWTLLEDCRLPFDNLVELTRRKLGGCCTVTVRPEDIHGDTTLQTIVNQFIHQDKVVVCLMPGVYELQAPLRLGHQHSNLTLEACHDGVVIKAAAGSLNQFLHGLVVLTNANNVTLRGLRFDLPQVPFTAAGGRLVHPDAATSHDVGASLLDSLCTSIGVRSVHCAQLSVERCLFRFSLTGAKDVFGAGIFAASECWGFRITECRFVREEDFLRLTSRPLRALFGYLLAPTATGGQATGVTAVDTRGLVRTILQDARIEENLFSGLSAAALIIAQTGVVTIDRNIVRECASGFWLLSLGHLAQFNQLAEVKVSKSSQEIASALYASFLTTVKDPLLVIGRAIAGSYPLPNEFSRANSGARGKATKTAAVKTEKAAVAAKTKKSAAAEKSAIQNVFNRLLDVFHGPAVEAQAAVTGGPATGPKAEQNTVNLAETVPSPDAALAEDPDLRLFVQLRNQLAAAEQKAFDISARAQLTLALSAVGNEMDVRISRGTTSSALVVADTDLETQSNVMITGNTIRNQSLTAPAVLILLAERCAVTGNIIANEQSSGKDLQAASLALFPLTSTTSATSIAITGNVFKGPAHLPPRSGVPSPMDNWHYFNAEF